MFLKSIILNNIRSYKNQTIFFQEGITLLSGDIGSGKSSILFAIEFALFGASRPDIPAEALIRKGTSHASVTLNFKLQIQNNYQEFIIHRTLKKTKLGIKQTGGYIIQNGQKFELTAIELKAKIIELLSYPEEFISKGKNYIYRYTIYCPQEEMKQILIDSTDNRFDILRKIFNIEKYKLVRENIVIYLKSLRKEITILETRCEQLPMKEQEQQQLKAILVKLINEFSLFSKDIAKQSKIYKTQRQSLDILNSNQRKRQDIISKKETLFKLYQSLEKREQQLDSNLSNLVSRRKSLLIASNQTADSNQTIDIIRAQILELTNKSQAITSKHQEFQHQLKSLQNQIKDYK
jgi:DNA repair protein SbcC/Rad50